jgi:hypothetical protein
MRCSRSDPRTGRNGGWGFAVAGGLLTLFALGLSTGCEQRPEPHGAMSTPMSESQRDSTEPGKTATATDDSGASVVATV